MLQGLAFRAKRCADLRNLVVCKQPSDAETRLEHRWCFDNASRRTMLGDQHPGPRKIVHSHNISAAITTCILCAARRPKWSL